MFLGEWKKCHGITEPKLARLLGISVRHVSRIIRIGASPSLALDIERISRGQVTVLEALYPDQPDFVQRGLERRRKEWLDLLNQLSYDRAA